MGRPKGARWYRQTLSDERRILLDRYRFEDAALKVVGIGSVGTRCFVGLFFSEDNHPLILQFKEARRSVLEPYTEKSQYDNQGQRVAAILIMKNKVFETPTQRGFNDYLQIRKSLKASRLVP